MEARAYHSSARQLSGAYLALVAIFQTTVAPQTMEGIVVDMHRVRSRPVIGAAATNKIMVVCAVFAGTSRFSIASGSASDRSGWVRRH